MGVLPKPLSNEELKAIRDKAQGKGAEPAKPATAEEIAYDIGLKGLIPVIRRIEALEARVKELENV